MTDSKTGKVLGLSEVERRKQHIDKMIETAADMQSLVEQCLDNHPGRRPLISVLSENMKRLKKVYPHVNMNPITWQQREQTITAPTAKVQVRGVQFILSDDNICLQQPVDDSPVADSQVDIFSKTVKWEELAPLPIGRSAHTAVLLGGNVYVGGGIEGRSSNKFENSYRLDVYNLTTNQWSPSPITTPYC